MPQPFKDRDCFKVKANSAMLVRCLAFRNCSTILQCIQFQKVCVQRSLFCLTVCAAACWWWKDAVCQHICSSALEIAVHAWNG